MRIRAATIADIEGLAGLAETIRLRRPTPTLGSSSARTQTLLVRRRLERSPLPVLVADDDGELGLAAWCTQVRYRAETWWVLDELLVAPGGWPTLGVAVVAAVAGRAKGSGADGIALRVAAEDLEASTALAAGGLDFAAQWWHVAPTAPRNETPNTRGPLAESITVRELPEWFDSTPTSPTSVGQIIEAIRITGTSGASPSSYAVLRATGSPDEALALLDPIAGSDLDTTALRSLLELAVTSARRMGALLVVPTATSDTGLISALDDHGAVRHSELWTLATR